MKKIISALLIAVLILSAFAGCGKGGGESADLSAEPEKEPAIELTDDLIDLRKEISESGAVAGVAYLGWVEGDFSDVLENIRNQRYSEKYIYLENFPEEYYGENEGFEYYGVVPVSNDVQITVNKCELDENGELAKGDEIVSSDNGTPLLIRGNVSEIVPNLMITAIADGKTYEYTPMRSGEDGSLALDNDAFYDYTPYELMPEFEEGDGEGNDYTEEQGDNPDSSMPGKTDVPPAILNYDWEAYATDYSGTEYTLQLRFNDNGTASYKAGYYQSEFIDIYSGTWSVDPATGYIELDLQSQPVPGYEYIDESESHDFKTSLAYNLTEYGLYLINVGDTPFLYEESRPDFIFG